jgi:hypothetical protein
VQGREGWKDGDLEERRFFRTTSRWPKAVISDWSALRRSSLVVRPWIGTYPREPMDWETYVAKAAYLRLKMDGWSCRVDGGG